jgi:2'-5' RNA ligase
MRLFYALEFDSETKDAMTLLQQELASYSQKGIFTRTMNLHLTLCFLGDVEGHLLTLLKEILFSLEAEPLRLTFNQLGQFHKRQGDILWLGLEENRKLEALQKELAYRLRANNFPLDDQTFHPHVTLARGFRGKKLPAIETMEVVSDTITLMHSHQKQEVLTYTPLYTKQLQQIPII